MVEGQYTVTRVLVSGLFTADYRAGRVDVGWARSAVFTSPGSEETLRVAALYDVHGNLPALEAVLHDVRRAGADHIVVGGDVIPGPMQAQALDLLLGLELPTRFIRGNGEREVLAERAGEKVSKVPERFREILRWSAADLTREQSEIIATWTETLDLVVDGVGPVHFCHASPRNDVEIFTRITPEERLLPLFARFEGLVVCGHTHMQFDRSVGDCRVINAGSVGMPYGTTAACWLLLGPGIQLRQTHYDLEQAAERIRRSGYPLADEFAERDLKNPMSEADALALFSRVELA